MNLPLKYDYPDIETLDKYVVVAPRGEERWRPVIARLAARGNVVQVGSSEDKVSAYGVDKTGLDFLETVSWILKLQRSWVVRVVSWYWQRLFQYLVTLIRQIKET